MDNVQPTVLPPLPVSKGPPRLDTASVAATMPAKDRTALEKHVAPKAKPIQTGKSAGTPKKTAPVAPSASAKDAVPGKRKLIKTPEEVSPGKGGKVTGVKALSAAEIKAEVDDLLADLAASTDSEDKKRIRRKLRLRNHFGGLGKKAPAKPVVKAAPVAVPAKPAVKAKTPAVAAKK